MTNAEMNKSKKQPAMDSATAAKIYALKPKAVAPEDAAEHEKQISEAASPKVVAEEFGVSVKVVRNIWNRSSWVDATRHLWDDDVSRVASTASTVSRTRSEPSVAASSQRKQVDADEVGPAKRRASVSRPAERPVKKQCSVEPMSEEEKASDVQVDPAGELTAGSDTPRNEEQKPSSQKVSQKAFKDPFAMDWKHALAMIAQIESVDYIQMPSLQVM